MRPLPGKTAQWFLITILTAAAAFAAGQAPQLPEGEGKTILQGNCTSCHGLDLVQGKQATSDDWKGIVTRMMSYGVQLDEKQVDVLSTYLGANFGPKTAAPAAGAPAADDAGKKLLEGACGGCHGLDLVTARTGSKDEWQDIVDRMVGRGAGLTEKDVPVLVEYLTKTYAPKPQ